MKSPQQSIINVDALLALLEGLKRRGYRTVGPTVRDQAIVYDEIDTLDDLPQGWTDKQDGGHYELVRRGDDAMFGYAVGPQSWKKFLHPPVQRLWQSSRNADSVNVTPEPANEERFAFIGVRACELHAIAIQDQVLIGERYADPYYKSRRENAFIVAVNCSTAGGTCFCVSMNTGPKAESGFDLSLTEIFEGGEHLFLVETGTTEGHDLIFELAHRVASAQEIAAAKKVVSNTAVSMGREMCADNVRDLLMGNLDHPRWAEVADRCLTCGNCTMVCPTCFCTSTEDSSNLTGTEMSRTRHWDSCFTMDFSFIHGGSVRSSARSRYRQWMTHKLATWHDQFGTSGCVGCGRCITWCPVGIDITEEVRAIGGTGPSEGA